MSRILDRVLVCAYLAVAILPAVGIVVHFGDLYVAGALPTTKRPRLTARAFIKEKYQHELTAWFESHIGFKGYSIHVDNSLLYHVFDETKHGARVKVGIDDVLYEQDDLEYFSKYAPYLPTPAAADAFAAKIATLQARLGPRGKSFVPVIIPSKTSIYRAEIPPAWIRPLGSPPPTDEGVYRLVKRAFDAHGVRYVDSRQMLEASTEDRRLLWGRDARHWSAYAACLAVREVLAHHAALTGRAPVEYPCEASRAVVDIKHVDHDLSRLVNAVGVWHEPTVPIVAPPTGGIPGGGPSAMIIGCSFSWTLLRDAERSRAFGKLDMNYYNKTFVSWPEDVHSPVDPVSDGWRSLMLAKDLYILDLTETYALADGSYSLEFVDQLLAATAAE